MNNGDINLSTSYAGACSQHIRTCLTDGGAINHVKARGYAVALPFASLADALTNGRRGLAGTSVALIRVGGSLIGLDNVADALSNLYRQVCRIVRALGDLGKTLLATTTVPFSILFTPRIAVWIGTLGEAVAPPQTPPVVPEPEVIPNDVDPVKPLNEEETTTSPKGKYSELLRRMGKEFTVVHALQLAAAAYMIVVIYRMNNEIVRIVKNAHPADVSQQLRLVKPFHPMDSIKSCFPKPW